MALSIYMENNKENTRVREKPNFLVTFLNFWSVEKKEVSENEGISQSNKVTESEKRALLKSLNDIEQLGEETFNYGKTKRAKKQPKLKGKQITGKVQEQQEKDKIKNEQIKREDKGQERI